MKKDITALFCFVNDFCKAIDEHLQNKLLPGSISKSRVRSPEISISEIVTIIL